jgi:hypothetical protein
VALNIELQDEDGKMLKETVDADGVFGASLPKEDDDSWTCLRFIDPYGDTTFNTLQAPVLLQELARLRSYWPEDSQLAAIVDEIEELAREVQEEIHLYLKFIGD